MELEQLVVSVPTLCQWSHAEKIKFFAWYLNTHLSKASFTAREIRECYDQLHLEAPGNIHRAIGALAEKKPADLLKSSAGHRLEARVRKVFDSKFGERRELVKLAALLETLPEQVPDFDERLFLDEAIKCLRVEAYRAAIVMAWNLAYHHLCRYIVSDPKRLHGFNVAWPKVYQGHHRKGSRAILEIEDFEDELKESETIEIANSAGIITGNIHKLLKPKLSRRNAAAHPSSIKIERLQAEEFIDDLVKNVVLRLV